MTRPVKLTTLSDVRRFFHRNERPIYFVGATNFNLQGLEEWVRGLRFVVHLDSFDGRHGAVFSPSERPHPVFASMEDIVAYLLEHPEVAEHLAARGGAPALLFLMFDERSEELARRLGAEIWLPPAALRRRVDDKVETVRLGERAGVRSVPGALGAAPDYAALRRLADEAGLGDDLVVQLPFGDSGNTTYFVRDQADFDRHAAKISAADEVKVMRRINCFGAAIEACATRCGTLVGPLMTELIGFPELTPYRGGWCGNEAFPGAFTPELRARARAHTRAIGEQLRAEGYRGYFELDFLVDRDTGELWLGELNPRITGASPITNHVADAYADAPLLLFHLLEFCGVDFELDVDAINARWADDDALDASSQIALKHTEPGLAIVTAAPESGVYRLDAAGELELVRRDHSRRALADDEALFLRILRPGDYRFQGADLGVLTLRGRAMDDDFRLAARSRRWLAAIRRRFCAQDLGDAGDAACPPISQGLKSAGAALYQQSYECEEGGQLAAALAALERLPAPLQDAYLAHLRRGWLLYRLGRHREAADAYAAARSREPDSLEARLGALAPLLAEGDLAGCARLAREVLRRDPLNYTATLRLAYVQYMSGEYPAAIAGYRRLLDAYPGALEVKSGLAWSLLQFGGAAEATRLFREVLEVAPRDPLARDGLLALAGA